MLLPRIGCLIMILQGCATTRPFTEPLLTVEDSKCLTWFENIQTTLEARQLADPGTHRHDGFPYLRSNRFLASMADQTATCAAYAEWLEELRQLDAANKIFGFSNLPATAQRQLVEKKPTDGSMNQAIDYCGRRLTKISENNLNHKKILLQQSQIPDAYQAWKRAIGFYPLARYIANIGVERLHRDLNTSFQIDLEKLPVQGQLIRYSPQINEPLTPEYISTVMQSAYQNPLRLPRLTPSQLQRLINHFAPAWEIDTRNDTDKMGSVGINSSDQPEIDIKQPAVYVKRAYTRWQGKVLLQLIYQIWLPAREKTGLLDLYGGALDSVIWRVTLSSEGAPLAFDSIHGCGCYYLLFPGQGHRAIAGKDDIEPVLNPKSIKAVLPGQRLLLRLQSRTHYLQQVMPIDDTPKSATHRYKFLDLEQLRSLPRSTGVKRSLYDKDGLINASSRLERFLLWPYGVASPGAMRQWGTHAIAFIGKRHFDDPYLLEELIQ